jgi:hypothetical protein
VNRRKNQRSLCFFSHYSFLLSRDPFLAFFLVAELFQALFDMQASLKLPKGVSAKVREALDAVARGRSEILLLQRSVLDRRRRSFRLALSQLRLSLSLSFDTETTNSQRTQRASSTRAQAVSAPTSAPAAAAQVRERERGL